MSSRSAPSEPAAGGPPTLVSLARVSEVVGRGPDRRFEPLLSPRERRRWTAVRHAARRREWLAGRLVAKHAFLVRFARIRLGPERRGAWRPEVVVVSRDDLASSAASDLARVEVLGADEGGAGRPELVWCGRAVSDVVSLSIAHAGGWVAVALGVQAPVGVDVEVVRARSAAFRRSWFTDAEIAWAESGVAASVAADARYTLLWTLKEAAFKTGRVGDRWRPRDTELHLGETLSEPWSRDPSGEPRLAALDVRFTGTGRDRAACMLIPAPSAPFAGF
jgi:4'-phosphopantetheinyl transferase EntD